MKKSIWTLTLLLFTVVLTSALWNPVNKGERIIFFGDSITELGGRPNGYVTLVRDSISAKYKDLDIEVINAGVGGNKINNLISRLDNDVLSKNPTAVVIYIGINDVWHYDLGIGGTPKDKFEAGLKEVIGKMQNKGIRVILCTPSVVGERFDGLNKNDKLLNEYSSISRGVAREMKIQLLDLRKIFIGYEAKHNRKQLHEGILTVDAVHLNDTGNKLVAKEMLKALEK